jgi:hypothetical protein
VNKIYGPKGKRNNPKIKGILNKKPTYINITVIKSENNVTIQSHILKFSLIIFSKLYQNKLKKSLHPNREREYTFLDY